MDRAEAIEVAKALQHLIEVAKVSKILSTFISAFMNKSVQHADSWYYLHGNFNINGPVSGRMSSSGPNLQNLPSTGSKYAPIVKSCFVAPPGWVMCGADFLSLEDRISALTTKDPNKLKVYTDGMDGHCLRAYSYYAAQMPDIQLAEEGDRCFTANVGGTDICFTEKDVIHYQGIEYSGVAFYEKITGSGI